MSQLLARWIHDDLKIPTNVTSFEVECANGYLLGQILNKLGFAVDVKELTDTEQPRAVLKNFAMIAGPLKQLNVPFNSRIANSIISQEQGIAAKLIYQIKMNSIVDTKKPGGCWRKHASFHFHHVLTYAPHIAACCTRLCSRSLSSFLFTRPAR